MLEREPVRAREFSDLRYEWRRWFSELFGTFLLVMAAAGASVVDAVTGGHVGRVASVAAPAITVLAVILFMGAVSGAHLNPVVTIAFTLRGDFRWRRVPDIWWPNWRASAGPGCCCEARSGYAGTWA